LRDLSKGCHGDSSVRVIVSPVEVGVWRAVWIAPTYVVVHTRRQSLDSLISEQEEVLAIVPRKLIERVSSPDDFLRMLKTADELRGDAAETSVTNRPPL